MQGSSQYHTYMFFNDRRKKKSAPAGYAPTTPPPTEEHYIRMREDYQRQKAHEANMRKAQEYAERPRKATADNSTSAGYAVGTRKYNSPTPGRNPKPWL